MNCFTKTHLSNKHSSERLSVFAGVCKWGKRGSNSLFTDLLSVQCNGCHLVSIIMVHDGMTSNKVSITEVLHWVREMATRQNWFLKALARQWVNTKVDKQFSLSGLAKQPQQLEVCYGHRMQSWRPDASDEWYGRMARDSQGNPCKHSVIYIYIYIYIYIKHCAWYVEYENFVNAHLEAAAKFIPTKLKTKSWVPWETLAIREKRANVKTASKCNRKNTTNTNALKLKKGKKNELVSIYLKEQIEYIQNQIDKIRDSVEDRLSRIARQMINEVSRRKSTTKAKLKAK